MQNKPERHLDAKRQPGKETDIKQELHFDDQVIAKIVGLTTAAVDGVLRLEGGMFADMTDFFRRNEDPTKGVAVDVKDDQRVKVELDATMKYGEDAPAVFKAIVAAIEKNVRSMTGLTVTAVTLTVKDMLTDEELAQQEAGEKDQAEDKNKDQAKDQDQDEDLQPA